MTPVNIRGEPIAEADLSKTGGWIATLFIFGNEMAERMAYYGLSINMVIFMFKVMHKPFTSSANAVNNFLYISSYNFLGKSLEGRILVFWIVIQVLFHCLTSPSPIYPMWLLEMIISISKVPLQVFQCQLQSEGKSETREIGGGRDFDGGGRAPSLGSLDGCGFLAAAPSE